MKMLLTFIVATIISLNTYAGDMYIMCWFDGEYENTAEALYDTTQEKAMLVVDFRDLFPSKHRDERYLNQYVVIYQEGTYKVIKTNTNNGGFTEYAAIDTKGEYLDETSLVDGLACFLTD